MNCVLLLPILVFAVLISSADAARAPEPGFLNAFQQPTSVFRARRQQQQQHQQPGVLGCLTPCTRELRVFVNRVIIQQISLMLITVDIKYCLSSTCPCFHQPDSILSTCHKVKEKGISEL